MNTDKHDDADALRPVKVDEDLVLELNFVPSWARKPASTGQLSIYDDRRGGGTDRRGPRDPRDPRRRDDRSGPRRPEPPRRGSGTGTGSGPERDRPARPYPPADTRGEPRRSGAPSGPGPSAVPLPPVTVRFLPEQRQISAVIQQITATRRAYPLMELAALILNQEGACFVRIEVDANAGGFALHQCKRCGFVATDVETLRAHVLQQHFEDWFLQEETETERPGGVFVCVARCGLSGILLGPPNHHLYSEAVRETHAARYPQMDMDSYKARIVMSHDPADIEAWRAAAARRTVYRLTSGGEEAAAMTRTEAEGYARTHLLTPTVTRTRRASLPEAVARQIADEGLRQAIRETWRREHRFPLQLSFALRAAFRHKHLHFFKAGKGKGTHFVTAIQPVPLDPTHTIETIQAVLTYLREHPGCSRAQLLEGLRPGADAASEESRELLKPLTWLIDRGHIIEFFNGTLSVPLLSSRH